MNDSVIATETDSLLATNVVQKTGNKLIADGFLKYTLTQKDTQFIFQKGKKYTFGDVKMDDNVSLLLAQSGYKRHLFPGSTANAISVLQLTDRVLSSLENQGYIYATLQLKDSEIVAEKINTTIAIDKGKQILYDSLNIIGSSNISKNFIHRYLGIKAGQPFNAEQYRGIQKKIKNLVFLENESSPQLNLVNERAEISLDIKDTKASRFDFIIGVLPQESNGGSKYKIIGEFTTEMNNFFGYGASFYAHIKRLQSDNQELNIKVAYPYLFNTPVISEGSFQLYRNGGDFLELKSTIGASYPLNDVTTIGGAISYESSRLIDIDSVALVNTGILPQKLDVSLSGFTLSTKMEDVDYRFNPSNGYSIDLQTSIARKNIIRNRTIESLSTPAMDFVQAYDTIANASVQLRPTLNIAYYRPLFSRFILKAGNRSGYIFNNSKVYENEYFRLGGHQLLRGFDELSILTDAYSVIQTEVRLLLNQNSFISLPFVDYGFIRYEENDQQKWDQAIGIGMGMNFGTPVGMFNISFATGKRRNIPFDFNNVKVHFGYVSLF